MNKHSVYRHSFVALLSAVCLSAGTGMLQAKDEGTGLYVNVDAGASFVEDIHFADAAELRLDPGVRATVAGGYTFYSERTISLSGEIESGVVYNSLNELSAGGVRDFSVNGDFYQIPFLVNFVITSHATEKWSYYIGFGGGAIYRDISSDTWDVGQNGTDGALQAKAGVAYEIVKNMSIGAGYRFLVTFPGSVDAIQTHCAVLSFQFKF